MSAQEVDALVEELQAFLNSLPTSAADEAVDPELLNAVADYVEGVDPNESGVEKLRQSLAAASTSQHETIEERMKTAGSRRSLKLLREAFQRV